MNKTKVNGTNLRIFEAFAGIGAQRKALKNIKAKYEVVGMAEWYVPAIISYQAIHNNYKLSNINHNVSLEKMISYLESKSLSINSKELIKPKYWKRKNLNEIRIVYTAVKMSEKEGNIFDVRTLYKRGLKDIDLLTYSFPCQDLSQQGKQKGMKKDSGTRSGLLWEIEKALDVSNKNELPEFLLMENVVALTHKANANDLNKWIQKLKSYGYNNRIGILNSGDFGSPQARKRVFMISSLNRTIDLPKGIKKPKAINSILDKEPIPKDFMPALDQFDISKFKLTKSNIKKGRLINYSTFNSEAFVYNPNYTGPTLTASGANSRIKLDHNGSIRKMNAREAYKYMGFTQTDFDKVNNLNILNQAKMIYTCGNSISVEVLEKIMEAIYD